MDYRCLQLLCIALGFFICDRLDGFDPSTLPSGSIGYDQFDA